MRWRLFPRRTLALAVLALPVVSSGDDWPTYHHDRWRSGVTSDRLTFPLHQDWVHRSRHAPRPAWPAPARQDFWHNHKELQPAVVYDRAFHVAVADGGLFYGSSAEDTVCCLDPTTGQMRWSFFTEGPVRLAPTVSGNRVYAGSDDGRVYCLDASSGDLIWKRRVAPTDRRIPGNGRMISVWPVRTGVLVDRGVAYCCAGLFPNEGVFVSALDAKDGSVLWMTQTSQASPQGYLLTSDQYLLIPTGRTAPALFSRVDGAYVGQYDVQGGSFALVADEVLISGPGRTTGSVDIADAKTRERIASFNGLHMVVNRGFAYLHSLTSIAAMDRVRYLSLAREKKALDSRKGQLERRLSAAKAKGDREQTRTLSSELSKTRQRLTILPREMRECFVWQRPCRHPYSCILVGDTLLLGGDNEVVAFNTADGSELWTGRVDGRAYGLAVADSRLFVSTDKGAIHCFIPGDLTP